MHLVKSIVGSLALLASISAHAVVVEPGFYGKLELGYSKATRYRNDGEDAVSISGADGAYSPVFGGELGYAFGNNFRLGVAGYRAECVYKKSSTDDWDDGYDYRMNSRIKVQSTALLLNGYYDFTGFEHFNPYITLGGGVSFNKAGNMIIKSIIPEINSKRPQEVVHRVSGKTRANFAWAVGAGVVVPIDNKLSFDVNLKYMDYGKFVTSTESVGGSGAQIKRVGIRSVGSKFGTVAVTFGVCYKF